MRHSKVSNRCTHKHKIRQTPHRADLSQRKWGVERLIKRICPLCAIESFSPPHPIPSDPSPPFSAIPPIRFELINCNLLRTERGNLQHPSQPNADLSLALLATRKTVGAPSRGTLAHLVRVVIGRKCHISAHDGRAKRSGRTLVWPIASA